jgi:hypothetical protein
MFAMSSSLMCPFSIEVVKQALCKPAPTRLNLTKAPTVPDLKGRIPGSLALLDGTPAMRELLPDPGRHRPGPTVSTQGVF